MNNYFYFFGWILATVMVAALSAVCMLQWREVNGVSKKLSLSVENAIISLDRKFELANLRWNSILESIVLEKSNKIPLKEQENRSLGMEIPKKKGQDGITSNEHEIDLQFESQQDSPEVLPEGIDAEQIMSMEFKEIIADSRINPKKVGCVPPILRAAG